MLRTLAAALQTASYRHVRVDSLMPEHVEALPAATIRNRPAALRRWAEKVGEENIAARDNGPGSISHGARRGWIAPRMERREACR
jgi:hypothetical protein